MRSVQSASSPRFQRTGARIGPSPQRGQQQSFVGSRGIQSLQQQEQGLGLLLETLEEGPHSTPGAALPAQHALQVQEEFCRRAPSQGPRQGLRGPALAPGTGGLQCCCPDTREEENTNEGDSYKLVKPRNGFLKIIPNFPPIWQIPAVFNRTIEDFLF